MKDFKKIFIIFDLDGVLFDSKNMQIAWEETSKKFSLDTSFKSYFDKIGMPFVKILKSLNIKQDNKIYKCFKDTSLRNIHLIKPYKDVENFLKYLEKIKIKYSIVTSKDFKRSKFLLNKFNIKPISIHCPNKRFRKTLSRSIVILT